MNFTLIKFVISGLLLIPAFYILGRNACVQMRSSGLFFMSPGAIMWLFLAIFVGSLLFFSGLHDLEIYLFDK